MTCNQNETTSESVPPPKPRQEIVSHFMVMGAAAIIILAGFKAASAIVSPMLLALFVTIILVVPLRWLRRQGCPNGIALILVLGGTILLFSGVSYFLGRSLNDFILRLPAYKNRIVQKLELLDKQLEQYGFVLGELRKEKENTNIQPSTEHPSSDNFSIGQNAYPVQQPEKPSVEKPVKEILPPLIEPNGQTDSNVPSEAESVTDENNTEKETNKEAEKENEKNEIDEIVPVSSEEIAKILDNPVKVSSSPIALNPESVMYWITKSLVELRRVVEGGLLVLIFTIFMTFEAARFPEKIDRAFGKDGPINNEHFHRIAADIRRYLFLKAITNVMSAVAATFVYWMFGVPSTLFWGVIAYFLYFIPNIGGTIAAILPGMLIFMTYDVQGVLLYAFCLVAIECAIAYGIEPKLLGHGLRLSTVVIILSLFSWGWLLGPVGLFLAAPLTIVVKIIFQAFKETEWIAILLDDSRQSRRDPEDRLSSSQIITVK